MTHGIQPKISVCLSVIQDMRKRSRSRAAHSGRGLLMDSEILWENLESYQVQPALPDSSQVKQRESGKPILVRSSFSE